jgi:hypothetical protein
MHKILLFLLLACAVRSTAQSRPPAVRGVYLDSAGVIRWSDTHREADFFGANYCLPSASDYRAAHYLTSDLKKLVREDMEQFARMGWNAVRLSFWGDFENSDRYGNLLENDHLDLMDYVIWQAAKRGIYVMVSPIVTYNSLWPDALGDTASIHGFSTYYKKSVLGTDPDAIAAQVNYLKQLLNHVNPYTHSALKVQPNVVFIEMINEPTHHSDDIQGSVRYINALAEAVRSTGCRKILLHNVSQDFNISPALQQSRIQGATFAWYPTGLNAGHALLGNYLPVVDHYSPRMRDTALSGLEKVVYEFDTPDILTGYLYPAMARSFREAGAQWATMFSYDMLATAPYNLGWQTHFMSMIYTPKKAVSAIIAAQIMKVIARNHPFSDYPLDTSFGPFTVSYQRDLGEMVTDSVYLYDNNTHDAPRSTSALKKIVGHGSSPIVTYEGNGIYFLDRINPQTWRLEVYPDVELLSDPFNPPNSRKLVARAIHRYWPMCIKLSGLGSTFTVHPLDSGNAYHTIASNGCFIIHPGVYILTSEKDFSKQLLPKNLGFIGINEFICPEDPSSGIQVQSLTPDQIPADSPAIIRVNVYGPESPKAVTLYVRRAETRYWTPLPMKRTKTYGYEASLPAGFSKPGYLKYLITVQGDDKVCTFPSGKPQKPSDWDYDGKRCWQTERVAPHTALSLLDPVADINKVSFTRPTDGFRSALFSLATDSLTGRSAFHLEFPEKYAGMLKDYTISVPVLQKVQARPDLAQAVSVKLRIRGVNAKETSFITLVETDGSSWSAPVPVTRDWKTVVIPVDSFKIACGVMLPEGYPGTWNYWLKPPASLKPSERLRLQRVQWLQLSMRPAPQIASYAPPGPSGRSWLEISEATFSFSGDTPCIQHYSANKR